jgi:hypothetical protein
MYITKENKNATPFSNHPIPHLFKKQKKSHLPTLRNNQTSPSHITQENNPLD